MLPLEFEGIFHKICVPGCNYIQKYEPININLYILFVSQPTCIQGLNLMMTKIHP